jgi:DNA polymerase-3 subunit epsilon
MRRIDWPSRWRSPRWDEATYWALDLETSGLRPSEDCILAVGMVPIRAGRVRYGERFSSLVRPPADVPLSTEGIGIHHLMPADLAGAPRFDELAPAIGARLAEGPLVVHHAPFDVGFLEGAWRKMGQRWPAPTVVDTQALLLRWHHRKHRFTPHPPQPVTGLAEARAVLGLPAHVPHDALSDALATAELLLALRERLGIARVRGLR